MSDEVTQFSNVLRGEPNTGDVPGSREIGEEFGVGPIGLIGRLLHSCDVAGMGEFDRPFVLCDKDFGEKFATPVEASIATLTWEPEPKGATTR